MRYRLSAEEKDLDYVDEVLDKIRLKPELCFLAGTPVSRADGTPTNIEDVRIGDMVTAYDRDGNLVPGRVSAVHCNQVDHILDVHGLMVTPGHVTLCGDGPYANKHVPIIDILRTDGALVREDGTKVRAATGSQLGDPDDHMVWAITGETQADGSTKVLDKGQIRLGTRVILSDGADVSVGELITRAGGQVNDKGLIVHEAGGTNMPFVWVFGDRLPRPEDYVLQRSGLSLMDLYDGAGRPTSDLSMHQ
ncbi:MAG: Hint domain-containing protein [Pseudomonadota bacterium]